MVDNMSIVVHTFPMCMLTSLSTDEISYLPTPPLGQDMTQGQFLSRV